MNYFIEVNHDYSLHSGSISPLKLMKSVCKDFLCYHIRNYCSSASMLQSEGLLSLPCEYIHMVGNL